MPRQITFLPAFLHRLAGMAQTAVWLALAAVACYAANASTVRFESAPRPARVLADTLDVQICQNEFYLLGDDSLNVSGLYTDTLTASDGSDSVVTVALDVLPTPFTLLDVGICDSSTYVFAGDTLDVAGLYRDTLTAFNGCDSIVTLRLRVQSYFNDTLHVNLCFGETYVFGDDTLDADGVYVDSLTAAGGCDSVVTVLLKIFPQNITLDTVRICANASYEFAGEVLTQAGVYADTLTGADGCDSIATIQLEVLPLGSSAQAFSICAGETFNFNGQTLNTDGVYRDTLTAFNGCDSIVTLTLTVLPLPSTVLQALICAGESYLFNGQTYTDSGVYTATLTAENGCDSLVTLALTVLPVATTSIEANICAGSSYSFGDNTYTDAGVYYDTLTALNGCDSIVTLTLGTETEFFDTLRVTICEGEFFLYEGDTLDLAGDYNYGLTAAGGCDSTITVLLSVAPVQTTAIDAAICANETYVFGGDTLNAAGTYVDTLATVFGCDSIVTLTLDVLPTADSSFSVTLCAFGTYEFGGQFFDETGTYTSNFPAENGCDSVVTLHLTVLPDLAQIIDTAICAGETFDFYGLTLDSSGIYDTLFVAENGCDSAVVLHLLVKPLADSAFTVTICNNETFLFGGDTLNTAGVYVDTLTAVNGCDSIATLTLAVLPTSDSAFTATICAGETFLFGSDTLNASGFYLDTLASANGCDSLVLLSLTVLPVVTNAFADTICSNETYAFGNDTLAAGGVYVDTLTAVNGCDSIATLTLTVLPAKMQAISAEICQGRNYDFNGQSLSISGVYTAILQAENGCDSTVTLTLVVAAPPVTQVAQTICAGETYTFNGQTFDQAGQYSVTLDDPNGCDSIVTLTLSVLPTAQTNIQATICPGETYAFDGQNLALPGQYTAVVPAFNGCDSTITLTLTAIPASTSTTTATICADETYTFNGQTYNQSGSYPFVLTGANGCDSTATLNLTVLPLAGSTQTATICADETYTFNGQTYTQSGVYTATLTAANGCDSIATLTLTVLPLSQFSLPVSICAGESYVYDGDTLSQSGNYPFVFTAANGCDSTVTVALTVLLQPVTPIDFSICAGTSLTYNGTVLTDAGDYPFVFPAANGCDSTVVLSLTVTPSPVTTLQYTICSGTVLVYDGDTLSTSGAYDFVFSTANGCDSTVTIDLTILPPSETFAEVTICGNETYEFDGQTLTQSGVYTAEYIDMNGCDSISTLDLTVLPLATNTIAAAICAGEVYTFGGINLMQAGIYTASFTGANGCDSLVTLLLTVNEPLFSISQQGGTLTLLPVGVVTVQWLNCDTGQPVSGATGLVFTPGVSGNYAAIVSQGGCSVQSDCYFLQVVSTGEPGLSLSWNIQPNPAGQQAAIRCTAPAEQDFAVAIFDLNGRVLQTLSLPQGATALPLDLSGLPAGVLLVRITDGARSATKRLVVTGN